MNGMTQFFIICRNEYTPPDVGYPWIKNHQSDIWTSYRAYVPHCTEHTACYQQASDVHTELIVKFCEDKGLLYFRIIGVGYKHADAR